MQHQGGNSLIRCRSTGGNQLQAPDAAQLLFDTEEPPPFPEMNIFPLEWRVETPKLQQIYDASRVPGWSPHTLPWDTLDPEAFSLDERYALAYWFTILSVFDGSGPAVFSRAFIHTWETHEEDPIRKCFFSIVRDEVNHEEVCQRAIQTLTPNGSRLQSRTRLWASWPETISNGITTTVLLEWL